MSSGTVDRYEIEECLNEAIAVDRFGGFVWVDIDAVTPTHRAGLYRRGHRREWATPTT